MKFDYYYNRESDQFTFYRIPKVLFTDKAFSGLSVEAKLLYGLMLDRMSLSLRNGWIDENGRVYIYFTHADIQSHLGCGHSKATQLLKELDSGIGLIRRKRQGLGSPDIIYVMDFVTGIQTCENQQPEPVCAPQSAENQKLAQPYIPQSSDNQASESQLSAPQSAENQRSGVPEITPAACRDPAANKTEKTKTEISDIESIPPRQVPADRNRRMKDIRAMLKDKWGYIALDDGRHDMSEVNSIFTLGAEVLCSNQAHCSGESGRHSPAADHRPVDGTGLHPHRLCAGPDPQEQVPHPQYVQLYADASLQCAADHRYPLQRHGRQGHGIAGILYP